MTGSSGYITQQHQALPTYNTLLHTQRGSNHQEPTTNTNNHPHPPLQMLPACGVGATWGGRQGARAVWHSRRRDKVTRTSAYMRTHHAATPSTAPIQHPTTRTKRLQPSTATRAHPCTSHGKPHGRTPHKPHTYAPHRSPHPFMHVVHTHTRTHSVPKPQTEQAPDVRPLGPQRTQQRQPRLHNLGVHRMRTNDLQEHGDLLREDPPMPGNTRNDVSHINQRCTVFAHTL